jgi:hypothetical protein
MATEHFPIDGDTGSDSEEEVLNDDFVTLTMM